jgi:serine/threonine protein kinase
MKESDLFNELIQIADANEREARLQQIALSDPKLAESLRKLLELYQLDEDFLNTNALEQIASHPDATELLGGLKHFEEPKQYTPEELANQHLEPSDQPGSIGKFAGYDVLSKISIGGTATVYKGIDPDLEKTVVIKVLHTYLASDPTAIARLQIEARAMGRIKHKNVVEVYRISMNPTPFIVMEYVEGQSLEQFLASKGKLDLDEFHWIAEQILKGIQVAHQFGCVHRDLKPANILLTNASPMIAKITDFGLVRRDKDSRLTRTNSVVGTPRYMSPEQIKDQSTDARSDLFSLGAVFYEMLSGKPLFCGENQFAEMQAVIQRYPLPINSFRDDVPLEVETLLQRMLQKAPKDRYQSATDVLAALDSIDWHSKGKQGSLVSSPIPSARLSTKWFAALCAIAGFIVLGFLLTRTPRVTKVMTQIPEGPASPLVIPSEQTTPPPIPTIDHPWIHELRIPFASDVAKEYQQRWADALGIAVESENQFGIRFVLIPPGEFLMGYSPEDFARLKKENDNNEAELQMIRASSKPTWVRISFPFYISKYEITEAERARVLGTDHSLPSVLDLEYAPVRPRANSEEHPVTRVPWEEAQLMCQRLNEKGGLASWDGPVTQNQLGRDLYRLPTEAEWEWACRSGRSGASIADPKELDQEVWMHGNTHIGVQLRGLKKPNAFGLHDMLGNVQEWCLDNFHENYFVGNSASDPLVNPLAITDHPHFKSGHILRGGAIIFGKPITGFTHKVQRDQYSSSWFTGFRIVRPIPPEAIARLPLH